MQEIKQLDIAVRIYDNQKYNTTFGKGLYRNAFFNATADLKNPKLKYLLDFYDYDNFANRAKTDSQMEILQNISRSPNSVYSWIKRYADTSKQHKTIDGCAFIDLSTNQITLGIADNEMGINEVWELTARACKLGSGAQKSPQLLATNSELAEW